MEVAKALSSQGKNIIYINNKIILKLNIFIGLLGFYKGNLIGLTHTWINNFLRFNSFDMLDYSEFSFYHKWNPFAKTLVGNKLNIFIFLILSSKFILKIMNSCWYVLHN